MKKEVTVEILSCDVCGKDDREAYIGKCHICQGDICEECSASVHYEDAGERSKKTVCRQHLDTRIFWVV